MSEIKENIAKNIYNLRIKHNLTQAELAEKLNYTDKSVSKWERGDVTPSIEVLKEISDLFNLSIDDLVSFIPNDSLDKLSAPKKNITNKIIITLLANSLVWLIATFVFFYVSLLNAKAPWTCFIIATPISLLMLLIFNCVWGKKKYTFIIISALIWSILATVYICLLVYSIWSPWLIFVLGVPLQIGTILWSQLKSNKNRQR